MSNSFRPFPVRRGFAVGAAVFSAVTVGLLMGTIAEAQTTVKGSVKEVTQKGRLTQLVVTDEAGNDHELNLTPRLELEIRAPGDADFVVPGQVLEGDGVMTNERLYFTDINVRFVAPKSRTSVRPQIAKRPPKPGESKNSYTVLGQIEGVREDPDYPEYTQVALRGTRGPILMLQKNFKVSVIFSDVEMIEEGAKVTMTGTEQRGRFNPAKIVIQRKEAVKAEDLLKD